MQCGGIKELQVTTILVRLTDRDKFILLKLRQGMTQRAVGRLKGLTIPTVVDTLRRLRQVYNVRTTQELLQHAAICDQLYANLQLSVRELTVVTSLRFGMTQNAVAEQHNWPYEVVTYVLRRLRKRFDVVDTRALLAHPSVRQAVLSAGGV